MIAAIAALLLCQLLGEVLVRALVLPLPGPVAGLGILFAILVWHGRHRAGPSVPEDLGQVADMLLRNLSLLFVPAAVGVVQYLGLLRAYAGQIAIAIVVSTTLAFNVTAGTFRFVSRLHAFRHAPFAEATQISLDEKKSSMKDFP